MAINHAALAYCDNFSNGRFFLCRTCEDDTTLADLFSFSHLYYYSVCQRFDIHMKASCIHFSYVYHFI